MIGQTTAPRPVGRDARAAVHILTAPAFAGHEDRLFAAPFYDAVAESWDWPAIHADWLWSVGQTVALRVAEALADFRWFPPTSDLLHLDQELLVRVSEAQSIALGIHDDQVRHPRQGHRPACPHDQRSGRPRADPSS